MKSLVIISVFFIFSYNCKLLAKDLLLSFDKCGTHYTLFALQYLTERPFMDVGGQAMAFKTGLSICNDKLPVYHSHVPGFGVDKIDKLIVLVRNPLEIFLRNYNIDETNQLLSILAFNHPFDANEEIGYPTGRFFKKGAFCKSLKKPKEIAFSR